MTRETSVAKRSPAWSTRHPPPLKTHKVSAMSVADQPRQAPLTDWASDQTLWRCPLTNGPLRYDQQAQALIADNGTAYPIRDDVVIIQDHNEGNNEVARKFYDGALWPKFRFWEWFTFMSLGGERRARSKILEHLPNAPGLKLLDVAIGDGVYLDWLPADWSVVGIDISKAQLTACRNQIKGRNVKLVMCEAEDLPFADHSFDAALSIGGFNYFSDPEKSLREMARVVKPGGKIVVADEVPDLTDRLLLRKIGLVGLERWVVSKGMSLGDDFTELVQRHRDLDIAAIGKRVLTDSNYHLIWRKVGYVLVGTSPC